MSELGPRLKQARLAKGVSLRQIEASTKISVGALEALEKDDYARLPGGIFARSFVRAYAGAVGLNPDDTVHEFLTEFEKFERDNERSAKRPEITPDDLEFLERQRRALRTLRVVLVLVAVLAITAIAYFALVWWPARGAQGPV
ncbi:MAG TPA: helix-turn-helix transcriptional regulator [Vicinamibacterales bacterium]|nr:helix-turn-helix transcriptional regulator [Vicinamibacterales bacterium]